MNLQEYGDEEAQLLREEEERQKLMDAIRLKHAKIDCTTIVRTDAPQSKVSEVVSDGESLELMKK